MAPVVEDLDEGDWSVGHIYLAAELLASAGQDAMGDLLPVSDDAARNVPPCAERVVPPGEQHSFLIVLDQQVHVGRGRDLSYESE